MNRLRPHLQRLAWIALVAVLALALAPAVSRALAQGGASAHCAMPQLQAAADDAEAGAAQGLLDPCGFCALGLVALNAPPARPAWADPYPQTHAANPWRLLRGPAQAPAWRGAQPRAPPHRA